MDVFFIECVSHYILMLCMEDGQFLITNETSNQQHETQKKLQIDPYKSYLVIGKTLSL